MLLLHPSVNPLEYGNTKAYNNLRGSTNKGDFIFTKLVGIFHEELFY